MKGNEPSHPGFARTRSEREWTASPDRLVIEGLSGLEDAFDADLDETAGEPDRDDAEARDFAAGGDGFRTAREMRAAQERFAAQRRSAVRREEGTGNPGFDGDALDAHRSDNDFPPIAHRPMQKKPLVGAQPPGPAPNEATASPREDSAPHSRRVRLPEARSVHRVNALSSREAAPAPSSATSRRTEKGQNAVLHDFPPSASSLRADAAAVAPSALSDLVATEPVEHTRPRHERAVFLPAVITSALLTSLLWIGLLWAFWKSFGQQWLDGEIDCKARSLTETLDAEVSSKLEAVPSMNRVLDLGSEYTLLDARFTNWVRLHALQASLWRTHARADYDEMISLGASLSSPEALTYFEATKRRTEDAYVQRAKNHPGLDIKTLFAGHRGKQEADLGAEDLLMLMLKDGVDTGDRARAAYLLRRFEIDPEVWVALVEMASSGMDLQVVFAAWDSLVSMTDYVPPRQGFDRDHLVHWWHSQGPLANGS